MKYCNSILTTLLVLSTACSKPAPQKSTTTAIETPIQTAQFKKVIVPAVITDPTEKAIYSMLHYWENYSFSDTILLANNDVTEQAFVDFIYTLPYLPEDKRYAAIQALYNAAKAHPKAYARFTDMAELYLYNPNSPYQNEDFYIPILEHIIQNNTIDEAYKIRPAYQLEQALKNRKNNIATDFSITQSNQKKVKLHAIKSEYVVLFFNNPDCTDCKRVKEYLITAANFNRKEVKIISVYTESDIETWLETSYPETWINGYNSEIADQKLYDLRAIPTLYLLDKNKRVLLKDAPVETINSYLSELATM